MKKRIFAICDEEEEYAFRFQEYLNRKKTFPFMVQVFTNEEQFLQFSKKNQIEILLISEILYSNKIKNTDTKHIIIMTSAACSPREDIYTLKKYQSSDRIIQDILSYYEKRNGYENDHETDVKPLKMIGIYTPVGRCLQTSFALLLGQLLSKEKSVLYLNFEAFSGFGKFLRREDSADLIDMMYLMNQLQNNFLNKFNAIVQTISGLDYIPPPFSFMDLSSVTRDKWIMFLEKIQELNKYEYLILDLSDNVQGLFAILQKCSVIYTITKEDGMALAKIDQYEQLLKTMEFHEILDKTKHFNLPVFKNIPYEMEQLPFCELANYVKAVIREDLDEEVYGM